MSQTITQLPLLTENNSYSVRKNERPRINDELLTQATSAAPLSARHIARMQKNSGLFNYEYDFLGGKYEKGDNIVRQTGAGYGLGEYLVAFNDPVIEKTLEKAITAYQAHSIPFSNGQLVTTGDGSLKNAKTGATALALISELFYFEATNNNQFENVRKQWLTGLLSLRMPWGGFRKAPRVHEESPYFTGETWLALAHYQRLFPGNHIVEDTLLELDEILLKRYRHECDPGFFHWGVMAAVTRYQTGADSSLLRYATRQSDMFMNDLRPKVRKVANTSAHMEGLISVLATLLDEGVRGASYACVLQQAAKRVEDEMTHNMSMFITPEQSSLSFPSGSSLFSPELSQFSGAFTNGPSSTMARIDFTQHGLSALVKLSQLPSM